MRKGDLFSSKWWNLCKRCLGKSEANISGPLNANGVLITDDKAKASFFNDFFVSQS